MGRTVLEIKRFDNFLYRRLNLRRRRRAGDSGFRNER
jgi:hypothetical protein